MLVDNLDGKGWKVISTEFDFIEPDKKTGHQKRKIYIEPRDTETVTQQLAAVWQKIQARDFYTGCGKEDCHWCNFVKTNKLEVALHEINAEAEQEI
jgi:DNA helicase-2/ATP-dependent DNA helicase PcrA